MIPGPSRVSTGSPTPPGWHIEVCCVSQDRLQSLEETPGDSRRRPVTVGELNRAHQGDRDLLLCAGAEEGWALLMRASCKPPAGQCRTLRCGTLYTLWIILPSLQLDDCLPESGGSRQTLIQANEATNSCQLPGSTDVCAHSRSEKPFSHSVKRLETTSRINLVVGFIKILDLQTQRQTGVFCPPAPLLPQY